MDGDEGWGDVAPPTRGEAKRAAGEGAPAALCGDCFCPGCGRLSGGASGRYATSKGPAGGSYSPGPDATGSEASEHAGRAGPKRERTRGRTGSLVAWFWEPGRSRKAGPGEHTVWLLGWRT